MTALNTLKAPAVPGGEQRPYEPSMEEILASIRRIIADDHSLPGRTPEPTAPNPPADTTTLESNSGASSPVAEPSKLGDHAPHVDDLPREDQPPTNLVHSEQMAPDVPATAELPPAVVAALEPHLARGTIAAPQFATPEGPHPATTVVLETPEPIADKTVETEPAASPAPVQGPMDSGHDEGPASNDASGYDESPAAPHVEEDTLDHHVPLDDPAEDRRRPHNLTTTPDALFSVATDHSVTNAFKALAATRLADNSEELLGIAREMIRPLLRAWIDDNLPSMVERMVRAEIERVARGGR